MGAGARLMFRAEASPPAKRTITIICDEDTAEFLRRLIGALSGDAADRLIGGGAVPNSDTLREIYDGLRAAL